MPGSRKRPLKVGFLLPDTEGYMDGVTPRWTDIVAMSQRAEAVGFDSLWVSDHLMYYRDEGLVGPLEGWSLITAVAAITSRVEIGPLVLCTGFRNPALLAKMADMVDEISNGRLILGIGAGWNEPEYKSFGYPFDHRVDRFEEATRIISGLLRNGQIDFVGTYETARDCVLKPRGPRPSGPPIMIGTSGAGPRMLRLTAEFADQWNVWFATYKNDIEVLRGMLPDLDAACLAVGRDPKTLERTAAVKIEIGPNNGSPMSQLPIKGTPEEIADSLRQFADVGISHVQVWLDPCSLKGIEAFAPVLELLDQ